MPSPFFSFAIPGTSLPLSLPLPPHPNPVISTEAVCAFCKLRSGEPASLPIQPASPLSLRPNFRTLPNKGKVIVPRRISFPRAILGSNNTATSVSYIASYINKLADNANHRFPIRKTLLSHSHQHLHLKQHRLTIEAIDRNGVLND
jgi:hypothetical protein